jgi:uncharacterized protein YprB with RNaseH-like and TPR domain
MADAAANADRLVAQRPAPRIERIEQYVAGEQVDTPHGKHWEAAKFYDGKRRHGTVDIGSLCELPHDLLDGITNGEFPPAPPERWAFLDTETTGLAGGSGTCAFLIGVGRITRGGFEVRQFFMRDYAEEPSQLFALSAALEDVDVLVTYNGKAFDIPLLETRYRMTRRIPPFSALRHLDLLHGARRLWRLRFESCKLTGLESRILGHMREDDVPGELIPHLYFDYLRTGRAARLAPIFLHNVLDILTLACLTGIVPWAFRDPSSCSLRHGAEMVSLARWLRAEGRLEEARTLFRAGISRPLPDAVMFRAMWDLAGIEKKLKCFDAAAGVFADLASCRNPHRTDALRELAKHHEHREKNYSRALELTEAALAIDDCDDLRRRRERLLKFANAPMTARLL